MCRYPELAGSEPFPESSKDPRVDRTSGRVVKVWQEQPDWGAITHPFGPKPAAAAAAPVAEKVPEPAPRSEEAPPAKLSDAAVDAADDDDTADDTADDAPAADGHPEGAEAAGAEEAGEAAAREDIRKPEVAVEAPSKHEQADLAPTDELAPTDDDVSQAEEENEVQAQTTVSHFALLHFALASGCHPLLLCLAPTARSGPLVVGSSSFHHSLH